MAIVFVIIPLYFQPIDYDSMDIPTFNLTVQVRDPDITHVDTAYIEVYITDYNDNPPVFIPNSQKVSIDEDAEVGTPLAKFSATDKDQGYSRMFE